MAVASPLFIPFAQTPTSSRCTRWTANRHHDKDCCSLRFLAKASAVYSVRNTLRACCGEILNDEQNRTDDIKMKRLKCDIGQGKMNVSWCWPFTLTSTHIKERLLFEKETNMLCGKRINRIPNFKQSRFRNPFYIVWQLLRRCQLFSLSGIFLYLGFCLLAPKSDFFSLLTLQLEKKPTLLWRVKFLDAMYLAQGEQQRPNCGSLSIQGRNARAQAPAEVRLPNLRSITLLAWANCQIYLSLRLKWL